MKLLLSTLFIFVGITVFGQISFRTGDASLDVELNGINTEAKADLSSFKRTVSTDFSVSTPKVDQLLKIMQPAEAYLTIKIADISGKPIDTVVESYKRNKDKGWGVIAKELGIKPGSAEFHALKGKKKPNGNSGNGNRTGNGNSGGKKK